MYSPILILLVLCICIILSIIIGDKFCWYHLIHCVLYSLNSPLECNIKWQCQSISLMSHMLKTIPQQQVNVHVLEEEICPDGIYIPNDPVKHYEDEKSRPNIIVIVLDDLDELISPYREVMKFTNQHLFEPGLHFTNSYTPSSICGPARVEILTGRYAHNTGVTTNAGKYGGFQAFMEPYHLNGTRMKVGDKCIVGEYLSYQYPLQRSGYYTAMIGKYMNGMETDEGELEHIPVGWDHFFTTMDKKSYIGFNYNMVRVNTTKRKVEYMHYGYSQDDHITKILENEALTVLNHISVNHTGGDDRPFFMYISPTAPHFPLYPLEKHRHLINKYKQMYYAIISEKYIYDKNTVKDKSLWLKNTQFIRRLFKKHKWHVNDFTRRMLSLHAVDEMIESIWKRVYDLNKLNNTVWLFTSDNGYNYGVHNLIHKMSPYETSIRVPFYIYDPRKTNEIKNTSVPVSLVDIAKTVHDLASISVEYRMDGQSLMREISNRPLIFQYGGYSLTEMISKRWMNTYLKLSPSLLAYIPHYFLIDVPPFRAIYNNSSIFIEYHTRYGLPIDNDKVNMDYLYRHYNIPTENYLVNLMKNIYNIIFNMNYREYELYDIGNITMKNNIRNLSIYEFLVWKKMLDEEIK